MEAHLPDTFSKEEKEEIERRHRLLIDAWQTRKEAQDLAEVDEAFYFAVEAHKDQRRRSCSRWPSLSTRRTTTTSREPNRR